MKRRLFLLAPGVLVVAAGFVAAFGGDALGDRAEALYLRQQSVQGALVSTLSSVEMARPALAEQLYGMEDKLNEACGALRQAGQRRFAGLDVDPGLELAIMTSLQECESATGMVETMIQQAQAGSLDTLPAAGGVDIIPAGADTSTID